MGRCRQGILDPQYSLDDQPALPIPPELGDIGPGDRGIEIDRIGDLAAGDRPLIGRRIIPMPGHPPVPQIAQQDLDEPAGMGRDIPDIAQRRPERHVIAVAQIVFPLRQDGGVDGHQQRVDTRLTRPIDEAIGQRAILPEIELKPDIPLGRGCNLLEGRDCFRGRAERNICLGGRPRQIDLALVPDQSRRGSGRGHQRKRLLAAKELDLRRAGRKIDQDFRAHPDALETPAIVIQGCLVFAAAIDIFEDAFRQSPAGHLPQALVAHPLQIAGLHS